MVPANDCMIVHKRLSKGFKLDRVCSVINRTGNPKLLAAAMCLGDSVPGIRSMTCRRDQSEFKPHTAAVSRGNKPLRLTSRWRQGQANLERNFVCCEPVSRADVFVVHCCRFHEGTRQVATTAAGFSDSFAPFEISRAIFANPKDYPHAVTAATAGTRYGSL